MDTQRTPFAFRLADARDTGNTAEWTLRDDVAVAGCTDPTRQGDFRYSTSLGRDNSFYC